MPRRDDNPLIIIPLDDYMIETSKVIKFKFLVDMADAFRCCNIINSL